MTISRRTFLVAGAGLVLAACGGSSAKKDTGGGGSSTGGTGGGTAGTATTAGGSGELTVVRFFPDGYQVPPAQRLTIGLATTDGALVDGPDSLTATVVDGSGKAVGGTLTAAKHVKGLPRAYYPFETAATTPGIYTLSVQYKGKALPTPFTVTDPAQVSVPKVGDKLVPVDTPTTSDAHGVNPICTRQPPCPLHAKTLRAAIAGGTPVAFLIATPAYCQTAICGPVLDVLLSQRDRLAGKVEMIHAEVYINDQPSADTVSPAVQAYKLDFEPCLFLADAKGVITHRLDTVFDETEVAAALDTLVA